MRYRSFVELTLLLGLAGCGMVDDNRDARGDDDDDDVAATPDGGGPQDAGVDFGDPVPTQAGDDTDANAARECFANECAGACSDIRSCCVGTTFCCTPTSDSPTPIGFACEGPNLTSCLDAQGIAHQIVGDPRIEGGRLHPGDGGLVTFGDAIPLASQHTFVTATLSAPSSCEAGCLDGVALGFIDEGDAMETTPVPIAALVLVGSANEVRFVVGENVVGRFALTDTEERFRLDLEPSGHATAMRDGDVDSAISTSFVPRNGQLSVFGRNINAGAGDTTSSVSEIEIVSEACDMPSAFRVKTALTFRHGPSEPTEIEAGHAPSIAIEEGTRTPWIAIGTVDGFLVGKNTQSDPTDFTLFGVENDYQLLPADAAATAIADPELLFVDGALFVYFTAEHEDGTATIDRALWDNQIFKFQHEGTVLPLPLDASDGTPGEPASYRAPSVHLRTDHTLVVVARVETPSGSRLEAFTAPSVGGALVRIEGELERVSASHGDDVSDPSLVAIDGAWQLYFSQRRGARYSLGLFASDDLLAIRDVSGTGATLEGGLEEDRLGVRSADAVVSDDGALRVVYEAVGASRTTLMLAERPLPTATP